MDQETDEAADTAWDAASEGNDRNELSPVDSLQDLQYFPNFYRLLKSLDSGEGLRTGYLFAHQTDRAGVDPMQDLIYNSLSELL